MNLEIYFKDLFGYVPRKRGRPGKEYYDIFCPDCNSDGNPTRQIWVNVEKGYWKCWRCEHGGDSLRLIMHLEKISYWAAKKKKELYETFYVSDTEQEWQDLIQEPVKIASESFKEDAEMNFVLSSIETIGKGSRAQRYLSGRGFNKKDVGDWGLKYCFDGRLKDRVVIPVRDPSGKYIRAWQGRSISGRKPLYLSTSETEGQNIKELVLNIHRVVDPIIIVEGFMDAMAVGASHAVCLLGKGITPKQLEIVRQRGCLELVVLFDGDAVGEADSLASDLRCFTNARFLQLPYGEDPASMGKVRFWDYLVSKCPDLTFRKP